MNDTIIKATQQIIKINKVDGKGWLVFSDMASELGGNFQSSFTFFTKKEAVNFCLNHK